MHYAAAGMTAAEIVRRRADSGKANMGKEHASPTIFNYARVPEDKPAQ